MAPEVEFEAVDPNDLNFKSEIRNLRSSIPPLVPPTQLRSNSCKPQAPKSSMYSLEKWNEYRSMAEDHGVKLILRGRATTEKCLTDTLWFFALSSTPP